MESLAWYPIQMFLSSLYRTASMDVSELSHSLKCEKEPSFTQEDGQNEQIGHD